MIVAHLCCQSGVAGKERRSNTGRCEIVWILVQREGVSTSSCYPRNWPNTALDSRLKGTVERKNFARPDDRNIRLPQCLVNHG